MNIKQEYADAYVAHYVAEDSTRARLDRARRAIVESGATEKEQDDIEMLCFNARFNGPVPESEWAAAGLRKPVTANA